MILYRSIMPRRESMSRFKTEKKAHRLKILLPMCINSGKGKIKLPGLICAGSSLAKDLTPLNI